MVTKRLAGGRTCEFYRTRVLDLPLWVRGAGKSGLLHTPVTPGKLLLPGFGWLAERGICWNTRHFVKNFGLKHGPNWLSQWPLGHLSAAVMQTHHGESRRPVTLETSGGIFQKGGKLMRKLGFVRVIYHIADLRQSYGDLYKMILPNSVAMKRNSISSSQFS